MDLNCACIVNSLFAKFDDWHSCSLANFDFWQTMGQCKMSLILYCIALMDTMALSGA